MKYILCQPAIKRFEWELEVCLTRLNKLGISDIVLLFSRQDDAVPKRLQDKYDVSIHVYEDDRKDKTYIPSIKPYLWMRYIEEDRTREKESYFYMDSDVLLRDIPDLTPTKNKWYASACESYISVDYIDRKGHNLLEHMCEAIGIDASLIREKNPIGGAQWAIKNPTYEYWKKVYEDSITLYKLLNKSQTDIQKWTAEMWAQLWNVYYFNKNVVVSSELDFSWPTDDRKRYYETKIFHNAGVLSGNNDLFFKGQYVNQTPFSDDLSFVNQYKASYEYVKAIREVINLAKYEVIAGFRDKYDDKEYFVGDRFPKPANKKVDKERIEELMSSENDAGKPLIKKVEE